MKLTWVVGRRNSEGGQKEESDSDSFVEHGGYDLCGLGSCWPEVAVTRLIYCSLRTRHQDSRRSRDP